jgi:hypothetical protein
MTTAKAADETQPLVSKVPVNKDPEDPLSEAETTPSISEDALDIIKLGVPIFIARLSFVGVRMPRLFS